METLHAILLVVGLILLLVAAALLFARRRPAAYWRGGGSDTPPEYVTFAPEAKRIWMHADAAGHERGGGVTADGQAVDIVEGDAHSVAHSSTAPVTFHTHPTVVIDGTTTERERYTPPSGDDALAALYQQKPELVLCERGIWELRPRVPNPSKNRALALNTYVALLKIAYLTELEPFNQSETAALARYMSLVDAPDPDAAQAAMIADAGYREYLEDQLARTCGINLSEGVAALVQESAWLAHTKPLALRFWHWEELGEERPSAAGCAKTTPPL